MKKTSLIVLLLIVVLVSLSVTGHFIAKNSVVAHLESLASDGIELSSVSEESGLATTTAHYELEIKDPKLFIDYINEELRVGLPYSTQDALLGFRFACDVEYPFLLPSTSIKTQSYIVALPNEIDQMLHEKSPEVLASFKQFLSEKGFLYFIEYNYLSNSFEGSMKDITSKQTFKDGTQMDFILKGTEFEGKGNLLTPEYMTGTTDTLSLKLSTQGSVFSFEFKGFESELEYKNRSTYSSEMLIKEFSIDATQNYGNNIQAKLENTKFMVSSDTSGEKAEVKFAIAFEKIDAVLATMNYGLKKFSFDIALEKVDKDTLEKLYELVSNGDAQGMQTQKETQETIFELISRGLELNIDDFSLQELTLESANTMQGFAFSSEMIIQPSAGLNAMNMKQKLEENFHAVSHFEISKDFLGYLNQKLPMTQMILPYAKEKGDKMLFEIKFEKNKLLVNDKAI